MNHLEVCCYFPNICVLHRYLIVIDLYSEFIMVREYALYDFSSFKFIDLFYVQHVACPGVHTSTHEKYVCYTIVACSFFQIRTWSKLVDNIDLVFYVFNTYC